MHSFYQNFKIIVKKKWKRIKRKQVLQREQAKAQVRKREKRYIYMCVWVWFLYIVYICWFEYFHIEKIRFQNQQPTMFKQLETASNRNETRRPQWNSSKNHNKWWWSISRKWFTICVCCSVAVCLLEIYSFLQHWINLTKFSVYLILLV